MQLPFDGGRSGRAPEKSNFSQTCSLLSRYIKGKGVSLRDRSLEIRGKLEAAGKSDVSQAATTIDFLANMEKPSQIPELDLNSVDPIPEEKAVASSRTMEENTNETSTSKEPKTAPLTIFYSGKIMVFDDFPADKARAVMLLASKVSPQGAGAVFQTAGADIQPSANSVDPPKRTVSPTPPPSPQVPSQQPGGSNVSDLPIARRSSLHRFLEKRKDRATARAPYQVQNPQPSSSKNEGPSSKNEASSSKGKTEDELDLNFKL